MSKATVIATLNPVSKKRVTCQIPGKGRLSDHLVTPEGTIIHRNGEPYENGELFPGDLINIVVVPQGGGSGKDIARTGIILAAQIGAAVLTGGMSAIASAAIMGVVSVGAAIGANALIPPPTASASGMGGQEQFQRLGALTGSRNQMMPYGTVPRVYGHRKVYPFHAAKPFTEIVGNNQYLRMLFNLGAGPLELSNPKIGDTTIGSFTSNNQFVSNNAYEGVQIEVGENPSLYSSGVTEINPEAVIEGVNQSVVRTTATDTEEISIDLTYPQGLFGVDDQGRTIGVWMHWRVEYRAVGSGSWTAVGEDNVRDVISFTPMSGQPGWRATGNKRETWRGGISWQVPSGQYEVRLTRIDGPFVSVDGAPQLFETAAWTSLRSITHEEPTDLPGTVQIGMRIKATDQISGILDNFSVEAKSRLSYYDGNQWQTAFFNPQNGNGSGGIVTSNPAWIIADVLTGSQNARSINKDRLDANSFKSFADNCESEDLFCNVVLDSQRTVLQTTTLAGSTGRGSLAIHDGVYKIIQDIDGQTPVQHFTPRNSWGFTSTRTFPKVPHAIRVNFTNPDADWRVDEAIVYDDGYSFDGTNCQFDDGTGVCKIATQFETLDLSDTVTDYDEAWKEGRFRMAEARLRPERYTMMADVENLVCQRGDSVLVSHDVPLWGVAWGRIKAIDGNVLTLDEEVTIEQGSSYNIRVRNQSGISIVKTVSTGAGTHNEITVNNTSNIDPGDLFMFGKIGTETQSLKVFSIEPQGDLSARLTLIDAAPEIYDADQGAIPEFGSNITAPGFDPETTPPPEPIITGIRSNGDSLYPDADGNPSLRITVSYTVGGGAPTEYVEGRFRRADETDGWTSFATSKASSGNLHLRDAERGAVYIIQIQARRGELTSAWVQGQPHTAGEDIVIRGRPENAIGYITEDLDGRYTEIPVYLTNTARDGIDYNIVVELDKILIPFTPTVSAQSGAEVIHIESQYIEAPKGSFIVKAPGQAEAEDFTHEEKVRILNEEKLPELEQALDELSAIDLTELEDALDALELELDNLNDVVLPGLQTDLDTLETDINTLNAVTLPNLQDDLDALELELANSFPITETQISDDAISTPKIQANAITAIKIQALAVTADKINASAVTANKIAANAIEANKIQAGAVIAGKLAVGAVAADNIQTDAVTANKILANAVTANKIQAAAVIAEKIATDAVTANKILAGTITSNEINVSELTSNSAFIADIFAQNATIAGTLTMGSGGDITNSSSDFSINQNGYKLATGEVSGVRSVEIRDSVPSGTVRGRFSSQSNLSRILVSSNFGWGLNISASDVLFLVSALTTTNVQLTSNGLEFLELPTSNPGGSDVVWNDGGFLKLTGGTHALNLPIYTETQRDNLSSPQKGWVIYNDTTSRPNYHNGTNWVNF